MNKLITSALLSICVSLTVMAATLSDDMIAGEISLPGSKISRSAHLNASYNVTDEIGYLAPTGTFFNAPYMGVDGQVHRFDGFILPPNVPVVWTPNYTQASTNSYYWTYQDATTNETAQYVGENLSTTYPGNLLKKYPSPKISQSAFMAPCFQMEDGRAVMQSGGMLTREIPESGALNLASIHNIDMENVLIPDGANLCMMKDSENTGSNAYWKEFFASKYGVDSLSIQGVVEYLNYGGAPYTISSIQMPAQVMAQVGGKVNLTIYPVNESGVNFAAPIASTQYVFENDCNFSLADLDFVFAGPILITENVAIVIDGVYDDPLVSEFRPNCIAYEMMFSQYFDFNQTGYVMLSTIVNNEPTGTVLLPNYGAHYWYADSRKTVACLPAAIALKFDVSYPFVYTNLTALQFSVFGGVRNFTIMSDKPFEELTLEAPEWLTIEGVNKYTIINGSQQFAGQIDITATAQASSFQNNGYIVFSTPGSECEIYVYQDELIGDVDANGDVDGADLNILINILLGKDNAANYDGRANINGDPSGNVTSDDINALINILLGN